MGACATKPRDVKDEGEAPLPLPAQEKEPAADGAKAEEMEDENKRTSLSHLFRESEKRREASENDEVSVKETISTALMETKGEEEEQTKAQVHPSHDAEIAETVEPKEILAPTHEESSVSPPIPISEAPVSEEKPVEVEGVKEVVSAPTHEETSISSLIPTSEAPVAEEKAEEVESVKEAAEDSSTGDIEQKTTVVEEKGHAKLEASSTAEKKEDAVLPSSTTETT